MLNTASWGKGGGAHRGAHGTGRWCRSAPPWPRSPTAPSAPPAPSRAAPPMAPPPTPPLATGFPSKLHRTLTAQSVQSVARVTKAWKICYWFEWTVPETHLREAHTKMHCSGHQAWMASVSQRVSDLHQGGGDRGHLAELCLQYVRQQDILHAPGGHPPPVEILWHAAAELSLVAGI